MNTQKTSTYIGIDPGYAITGYGIVSKTGNKLSVIDYGVITTKAHTDFPVRLLALNDKMRGILEMYKPDYMSIEELFMGHNHTTVIGTAQARGVVIVEAARAGIPVYEFTPGQVKLAVTGYGKADKNQVSQMVKNLLGLKEIPKPDDAADALALAICLANTGTMNAGAAVSGYQFGRYGYSKRNEFG
ncbi:MAG: crossover junction endodeoxyribonuclease RuvC [Clostridiales bacterium]|nr:crossover junction endodeoxyribonuclease RuvC [Clostridiales bacterium]